MSHVYSDEFDSLVQYKYKKKLPLDIIREYIYTRSHMYRNDKYRFFKY